MTVPLITDLNDPQSRMEGFFPELEHAPVSSFQEVLETLNSRVGHTTDKGRVFELLVKGVS